MTHSRLALFLITGLGLGRLRPAPGTIGSLPPPLLAMILAWLLGPHISNTEYVWTLNVSLALLGGLFAAVCVTLGHVAERYYNMKDPPSVVADELAGQSIALLFLPWRSAPDPQALSWNLLLAGTAFVAFRLIDVFKPPPCRSLQRFPSGWGIVVDDLFAGIYALIVTQFAARLLWPIALD